MRYLTFLFIVSFKEEFGAFKKVFLLLSSAESFLELLQLSLQTIQLGIQSFILFVVSLPDKMTFDINTID